MPGIGDLAPLLYRARRLRFSLHGEVRSERAGGGLDGNEELSGSLLAAPGGRYRAELTDEDGEPELAVWDGQSGGMPFPELLDPAWLLADFDLQITGETEHIGRAVYAVTGTPRQAGESRPDDRVTALVDAELGVLLRYEKTGRRQQTETAEFLSLTVRPGGETAAPEQVPAATSPDLSDEQVNLLCRSTLGPPRFSADLHEWADVATMMRLGQAALAASDLGRRTRWLRSPESGDLPEDVDLAARLTVAMPGCYRIEAAADPGAGPACTACDGDRRWVVYADRIAVRPAAPPPAGISRILDPAWLLTSPRLSVAGMTTVSGRPGLRVAAGGAGERLVRLSHGPLSRTPVGGDQVEAIIDVELGIVLRQTWCLDGQPVMRTDLDAVTGDVDPSVFRIIPPPGTRVVTGGMLAEAGLSPAGAAWTVAKGLTRLAAETGLRWIRRS
jgi:outer membrane lipoprotein-sorting protein